jgi:hypothetical protein
MRYSHALAQLYLTETYSQEAGVSVARHLLHSHTQITFTLRSEHYVWLASPEGEGRVKTSARHATKKGVRTCRVALSCFP